MDNSNAAPPGYGICRKCGGQFKRYSTTMSKYEICDRCTKPRLTTQRRSPACILREKELKELSAEVKRVEEEAKDKINKANSPEEITDDLLNHPDLTVRDYADEIHHLLTLKQYQEEE